MQGRKLETLISSDPMDNVVAPRRAVKMGFFMLRRGMEHVSLVILGAGSKGQCGPTGPMRNESF